MSVLTTNYDLFFQFNQFPDTIITLKLSYNYLFTFQHKSNMVYTALDAKNWVEFDFDALKKTLVDNQFMDTSMGNYAVYWLNRHWWNDLLVAILISCMYLIFGTFWIIHDLLTKIKFEVQFPNQNYNTQSATYNSGGDNTGANFGSG